MHEHRRVLLMMETSRSYGRSILRGVAKYARAHGPWIFHRPAPFYWGNTGRRQFLERFLRLDLDGAIVREQSRREWTDRLLSGGLPVVVAPYSEPFAGIPNILTDDRAIGTLAADHLLRRGFRHFAYCGFGDAYFWSRRRGRSFCDRVKEAGFEPHCFDFDHSKPASERSWQSQQRTLVDWLKSLPQPVGLMACNDDQSQCVLEACKTAELHVPEQVAIIGLGNDDLVCDMATPRLSSIALSAQKAGYEAAAVLDRQMQGQSVAAPTIVVRPSHVVARQSTNVFAVEDRYVLAALRFIHRRAGKEALQVDDVLDAVSISRRSLYDRFARTLGRSPHEEIQRVRVDRFTRLLVTTDLSVSQIASALGCADAKNLARYFKRATGMTPLSYRNLHGRR
ncbi:AraC family transcriptional regulator [Anaerobaca lacustris]|uniref:XylR family transcriptional regulator n=1 Tax=Anaerobaca lacustris TaxID=3044600 RepID=A0AAW6TYB0_9BACT|nr:XylR family transcriptional regulator [Sedimentisphaerales bacterium M17dextr]